MPGKILKKEFYTIQRIIDRRISCQGSYEYLVKWKNYAHKHNTWEPLAHLSTVRSIVEAFDADEQKRIKVERPRSCQNCLACSECIKKVKFLRNQDFLVNNRKKQERKLVQTKLDRYFKFKEKSIDGNSIQENQQELKESQPIQKVCEEFCPAKDDYKIEERKLLINNQDNSELFCNNQMPIDNPLNFLFFRQIPAQNQNKKSNIDCKNSSENSQARMFINIEQSPQQNCFPQRLEEEINFLENSKKQQMMFLRDFDIKPDILQNIDVQQEQEEYSKSASFSEPQESEQEESEFSYFKNRPENQINIDSEPNCLPEIKISITEFNDQCLPTYNQNIIREEKIITKKKDKPLQEYCDKPTQLGSSQDRFQAGKQEKLKLFSNEDKLQSRESSPNIVRDRSRNKRVLKMVDELKASSLYSENNMGRRSLCNKQRKIKNKQEEKMQPKIKIQEIPEPTSISSQLKQFNRQRLCELVYEQNSNRSQKNGCGIMFKLQNECQEIMRVSLEEIRKTNPLWLKDYYESFI